MTVRVGGVLPATAIRLYRAANALLARQVGTMTPVATVSTDPAGWQQTVITDPGAPHGWSRLQYRAVAVTVDDPDRAGMAVDSPPSRSYALLYPPPDPPPLSLTPNVPGSTATLGLVTVDTDAPRASVDAGDHTLAWVIRPPNGPLVRSSSSLSGLPRYPTVAAFAAATEPVGYVDGGGPPVVYLQVARATADVVGVTVDLADPLGRSSHVAVDIPPLPPEPDPVISQFTVGRVSGIVNLDLTTNVPLPPDPAHDWTLTVKLSSLLKFSPVTTMTFPVSTVVTIGQASDMPDPALVPLKTVIRRIDGTGRILLWTRSTVPVKVVVTVANSKNVLATVQGVTA